MYKRFKWNPEVRFEPDVITDLAKMLDGSKVFWGSTIELFHDAIPEHWLQFIFRNVAIFDNLIHIFLTKQPQNLLRWSPFPDNCWAGVSVIANGDAPLAYYGLSQVEAGARFISFEPLHGQIGGDELRALSEVTNWWIIGAQTPYSTKTAPRIEWVSEIIDDADKACIPVFLKDNLHPLLDNNDRVLVLRQEFPAKKHPARESAINKATQE